MIKEIVHDEEALAIPAEPATAEDAQVAQDLLDTLESLNGDAIMLAANQIGSNKAIIAYFSASGKPRALFNPSIKMAMRPQNKLEGCLSLNRDTAVKRFQTITVAYDELQDGKLVACSRKFTDFTAQAIQHGIDHCKGVIV